MTAEMRAASKVAAMVVRSEHCWADKWVESTAGQMVVQLAENLVVLTVVRWADCSAPQMVAQKAAHLVVLLAAPKAEKSVDQKVVCWADRKAVVRAVLMVDPLVARLVAT